MGKEVDRAEIANTIRLHDKTGDQMLNFREFVGIFDVYLGGTPAGVSHSSSIEEEM